MTTVQEFRECTSGRIDWVRSSEIDTDTLASVKMPLPVPPLSALLDTHKEIWGAALMFDPTGSIWFEALYVDLTDLLPQCRLFWTSDPYTRLPHQAYWQFMWVKDPNATTGRRRVIRIWWASRTLETDRLP